MSVEIEILYDRYANNLYRLALSYLKNTADAEDAVQAVFVKLIEGKAVIFPGKERALLTKITVNQCKDILRRNKNRQEEPLDESIPFSDSKDRDVFIAVMTLPEKYRIPVFLHYYEGYRFQEIAKLLRITTSAVSMRIHRAKNLLKSQLEVDSHV